MYYNATSWEPVPNPKRMAIHWLRLLAICGMVAFFAIGIATIWLPFKAVLPYWAAAAIIWGVAGTASLRIRTAAKGARLREM